MNVKFENHYTISKIVPDCLSIQYKGHSIDENADKYYYSAERQCSDTKYSLVGTFRKKLIKQTYLRDFYLSIATSCITSILRTEYPESKVSGLMDDLHKYYLLLYYRKFSYPQTVYAMVICASSNTTATSLFYDYIDELGVNVDSAEMIDIGLFNDHFIEKFVYSQYTNGNNRLVATINYQTQNGRHYRISTTKEAYDEAIGVKEDIVYCTISTEGDKNE